MQTAPAVPATLALASRAALTAAALASQAATSVPLEALPATTGTSVAANNPVGGRSNKMERKRGRGEYSWVSGVYDDYKSEEEGVELELHDVELAQAPLACL